MRSRPLRSRILGCGRATRAAGARQSRSALRGSRHRRALPLRREACGLRPGSSSRLQLPAAHRRRRARRRARRWPRRSSRTRRPALPRRWPSRSRERALRHRRPARCGSWRAAWRTTRLCWRSPPRVAGPPLRSPTGTRAETTGPPPSTARNGRGCARLGPRPSRAGSRLRRPPRLRPGMRLGRSALRGRSNRRPPGSGTSRSRSA